MLCVLVFVTVCFLMAFRFFVCLCRFLVVFDCWSGCPSPGEETPPLGGEDEVGRLGEGFGEVAGVGCFLIVMYIFLALVSFGCVLHIFVI